MLVIEVALTSFESKDTATTLPKSAGTHKAINVYIMTQRSDSHVWALNKVTEKYAL